MNRHVSGQVTSESLSCLFVRAIWLHLLALSFQMTAQLLEALSYALNLLILLSVFALQRIEVFVKQNNFLDALELALSFYNGTAMAVIGASILWQYFHFNSPPLMYHSFLFKLFYHLITGLIGNKEHRKAEIAAQVGITCSCPSNSY